MRICATIIAFNSKPVEETAAAQHAGRVKKECTAGEQGMHGYRPAIQAAAVTELGMHAMKRAKQRTDAV
jgi:hypothetical protein